MKFPSLFPGILVILAMTFLGVTHAQAQTNNGARGQLAFLSQDDRMHFLKVRHQVLDANPELKSEQESLKNERQFVKDKGTSASQDDRKTLFQNFLVHSKKMQDAMRQADPSVGPILDEINAKMKARFKQHAGQSSNGNTDN